MTEFRFTDEQWRAYQAIPEQGYSHRGWLEHQVNAWLTDQWEYAINTGSEYNEAWTHPTLDGLLREISVNGALGDRGSRIGKRIKAGPWQTIDRAELEDAVIRVKREADPPYVFGTVDDFGGSPEYSR